MKKMIITTSWDDGHKLDLKINALLEKYNLKGTFYIPKTNGFKFLTDREVREIGRYQEVGAHTLSHLDLTKINIDKAREEISGSKKYLEDLLEKEIKVFCYPRGNYNQKIKELVKKAGFKGARTTSEFCLKKPKDFFEMGTTFHVYPFPLRKKDESHYHLSKTLFQPIRRKFLKILKLGLPLSSFFSWPNLAKNLFDYIYQKGGICHFWGHSWEIEKYGLWEELEKVFQYMANRKDVLYLTNSQALESL